MNNKLEKILIEVLKKYLVIVLLISMAGGFLWGTLAKRNAKIIENHSSEISFLVLPDKPNSLNSIKVSSNVADMYRSVVVSDFVIKDLAKNPESVDEIGDLKEKITANADGQVLKIKIDADSKKESKQLTNKIIEIVDSLGEELNVGNELKLINLDLVKSTSAASSKVYYLAGFLGTFVICTFIIYIIYILRKENRK